MQLQPSPSELSPHDWPAGQQASAGHVPPHTGASEIVQVLSGATHSQLFDPNGYTQSPPSGQVPPHVGASEVRHDGTQPQYGKGPSGAHAHPGSQAPPHVGQSNVVAHD